MTNQQPIQEAVEVQADTALTSSNLRKTIFDDIFRNGGYAHDGWFRRMVEPILSLPAHRFVQLCYEFDQQVEVHGIIHAMRWLLPRFAHGVDVHGAEHIPQDGPVLILSNHPGTFDEVAITAHVSRSDLKIVANPFPILRALPAVRRHCIFSAPDPHARMGTLRSIIHSLRDGHTLLLFPTGAVDPDPRLVDGAEEAINRWSPSVEVILKKAPETQVVVTIVSGVVSPMMLNSPFTWIKRKKLDRQRVAETLQVAFQVFFKRHLGLIPKVTFGHPMTVDELLQSGGVQQGIAAQAHGLLGLHAPAQALV